MTIIVQAYGGTLKRDIVQLAFEECGQAGYEFELSPEEYDSALRRLNAMMADWKASYGLDLGFIFPVHGNGLINDDSGLAPEDVNVVAKGLSRSIAPTIGKSLSPEANQEWGRTFSALRTRKAVVPAMQMGRGTPRGAGNRFRGYGRYFLTQLPDDEIAQ